MNEYIFVHNYNDFSGSPRVLLNLANTLKKSNPNSKFYLITSNTCGILDDFSWDIDYRFNYKPRKNTISKLVSFFISQISIFYLLFKLKLFSKRKQACLIINTMLPFGASLASFLVKNKYTINYIHETYISPKIFKNFLKFFIKIKKNTIIYVSNYLMEHENINGKSQNVVYNPISPDIINKNNIERNINSITMATSLVPYKGIEDFINISHYFYSKKANTVFNLVLNSNESEFNSFLLQKNIVLPHNVFLFFKPNNLDEIYSSSGYIINLTNHKICIETFGLTLIEGMANGCIPIAPNYGGPKEVIPPSYGLLFDHIDKDIIYNFVAKIDRDDFQKKSDLIKRYSDRFKLSTYEKKIIAIFRDINNG